MSTQIFLSAFTLAASQIIGIGPQNAFVLKQGLLRRHVAEVVVFCVLCDVLLIGAGVFGVGGMLASLPQLLKWLVWLGAALMFWLSWQSFRTAWQQRSLVGDDVPQDRRAVFRRLMVVTLLNPYVWLDTVVLIGSISAAYGRDGQLWFMGGALAASLLWFSAIGLGARYVAPWFNRPENWQRLDAVIGAVMLLTAIMLLWQHG